jgi:hypothetical protein
MRPRVQRTRRDRRNRHRGEFNAHDSCLTDRERSGVRILVADGFEGELDRLPKTQAKGAQQCATEIETLA